VDARACLSLLYLDEYRYHFNPRPEALARALSEAQRAVELDVTSQLANRALAETQYFRRELGVFRSATERVLMLNPRDTSSIGMVALLTAFSGDWERGKSIMTRAMAMNPHHAGWVHFVSCFDHYRQREYGKALEAAEQINMPWYPWSYGCVTICHAQLGHGEAARKHLNDFLALSPRYAKIARRDLGKWFVSEEHVEHTLEGFAKAGLDVEVAR
jgi:tetratricopeptide (TPR) repeat protein